MSDLVAWLSACYDRAEQRAADVHHVDCAALPAGGSDDDTHNGLGPDVYEPDRCDCGVPSWRLADIGRKRKRLNRHQPIARFSGEVICKACSVEGYGVIVYWPCIEVRTDAEEFDGEPGYDAQRWAP